MNQMEDYIFTFVSLGDSNGGSMLSRREFLTQHENCWEELLRSGLSAYVCTNGTNLDADHAIVRLMAYQASLQARQHLKESMLDHYQLRHLAEESRFKSRNEERFQQMRAEVRERFQRVKTA
ncbi:MAG TPA: hypothetical protein V6D23_26680 [Candidatus Obscuribacterales bacterium]